MAKPVQTLLFDVVNKRWLPAPRFIVGPDGTLDVEIKETPPTDGLKVNPSLVLTYTSSNLTKIEKTIGGVTYTKLLTYDGSNNLVTVSTWS